MTWACAECRQRGSVVDLSPLTGEIIRALWRMDWERRPLDPVQEMRFPDWLWEGLGMARFARHLAGIPAPQTDSAE